MSESFLSIPEGSGNPSDTVVTLKECLQYQASHQPQREVYIFYDEDGMRTSITFAELYRKCKEMASSVSHLGIKAKDVVVITIGNSIELIVIYFGLMLIGAIPLSCLISRKDCSTIIGIVNKSNAAALVLPTINKEGRYFNQNELVENLRSSTLKFIISSDAETDSFGCLSLKYLIKSTPTHDALPCDTIDNDDVAVIMPTSGTTGDFKLVCHSYRNLYSMLKFPKLSFSPPSLIHTKVLSPALLGWLGGSLLKEVFNGTTRVINTGYKRKLDVKDMLMIAEKESCYILDMTPEFLSEIILRNTPIPKCVKVICTGGGPIPKSFQNLLEYVDYLIVGYGLLETGGISAAFFTRDATVEASIGGTPRPGVKIKIVDDKNETIRRGITGKILVKTPFSFISYLGDPSPQLNNDEWFDTEDIGYISEKGELYVIGRQAECITRGSFTAYACLTEQRILGCGIEGILEVVVVPVPDKILYQEVCACVVKKPDAILSKESLMKAVNDNVYSAMKPKYVVFVESLPRNQNGKIDRKMLQKLAIERLHLSE